MVAPATPEIAADVSFSNAETGRMPTPNKLNLVLKRSVIQPGAIGNKPSTSGVATGDYLLVQKADGLLYKVPGTAIGGGTQGPKGDPGPAGPTGPASTVPGPAGAVGPAGAPAWTLVTTAPFTVPAYNATVVVSVADTSWIAIGEFVYADDADGAGVAGVLKVQAKTSSSITLWNPNPPAASPPTGGSSNTVWDETPTGAIDGTNRNFTTASSYTANQLAVYLNGLRLRRIGDYTETGVATFQMVNAPLAGDSLSVDYIY